MSNPDLKRKRNEDYSLVLLDISRGYSCLTVDKKEYYFKHFSIEEMLSFDDTENKELEKAKKLGIKSSKEILQSATTLGSWSQKEEEEIISLEWTINHSTKALTKMEDQNQKRVFEKQIEKQRNNLDILNIKKSQLCLYSAEHLSQRKRYSKMVEGSIFLDENFKKVIKEKEIPKVTQPLFNKFAELSNRDDLLWTAYKTHFFDIFVAQHRSPLRLFDANANFLSLTIFQKTLLTLCGQLYNKLKNVSMPESITSDPIKVMNYVEPTDKHDGKNVSHGMEDLKAKMKSRGGELKPEDLLS